MKKTIKTPKKQGSGRKTTQKTTKKTVVRRIRKSRKKTKTSDLMKALILVGFLVAISAAISFGVINFINIEDEPEASEVQPVAKIEPEKKQIEVKQVEAKPVETKPAETPKVKETPPVKEPAPARPARTTTTATPAAKTPAATTPATPVATKPVTPVATTPAAIPENVIHGGTLVFIIDDAGNNLWELDPFLKIPGPLTIAVLPGLPHSAEAARRIRAAGKEVFLHQPMEAQGGQNPGPSAIYSNMNASEIRAILKKNIEEVGPVVGMNNHQGSKITTDRQAMETILAFCKENNLYFLDSRTTAETVVPAVARQMGIKIAERNVFLDNEQDKDSMLRSLNTALERARRYGSAVMIGHTWSPALAPLLAEQYEVLTKQGYTIKTASDVIR